MRIIGGLIFLACCFVQGAMAQNAPIVLDGERFEKQFIGSPPNGDKLVEFVRQTETFEKWTKLVGMRYQRIPRLGNDPLKVAQGMAKVVKETNPSANSKIIFNETTSEAIIDFLIWPPSGEYLEFNVFRYAKSDDGGGVISLQFANRLASDGPADAIDKFRSLRQSWVKQAAEFDMRIVHGLMGK